MKQNPYQDIVTTCDGCREPLTASEVAAHLTNCPAYAPTAPTNEQVLASDIVHICEHCSAHLTAMVVVEHIEKCGALIAASATPVSPASTPAEDTDDPPYLPFKTNKGKTPRRNSDASAEAPLTGMSPPPQSSQAVFEVRPAPAARSTAPASKRVFTPKQRDILFAAFPNGFDLPGPSEPETIRVDKKAGFSGKKSAVLVAHAAKLETEAIETEPDAQAEATGGKSFIQCACGQHNHSNT